MYWVLDFRLSPFAFLLTLFPFRLSPSTGALPAVRTGAGGGTCYGAYLQSRQPLCAFRKLWEGDDTAGVGASVGAHPVVSPLSDPCPCLSPQRQDAGGRRRNAGRGRERLSGGVAGGPNHCDAA